MSLEFRPIDLTKDGTICVRFREDSYAVSFGDPSRFYAENGEGGVRYLEWLKAKLTADSRTCVHLWQDGEIVGQIEMGRFKQNPDLLNVNLFYLAPNVRGRGLGDMLQKYVEEYMGSTGFKKARLTVSPTNTRAIAYYSKQGWKMIGPFAKDPSVNVMEFCADRLLP